MPHLNKKIAETLKYPKHGTMLDGVFCSEAIDTSGESIDIREMDISSLNSGTGIANTEHINPDDKEVKNAEKDKKGHWSVIVGRIIFAKKIFGPDDCESERELDFWNELELPFVYGAVELFDKEDHVEAKSLAAMVQHYHNRNLPVVARYSIEGSTVSREGNVLKHTIAKRVAITIKPCSHAAVSSFIEDKKEDKLEKNENYISTSERECFPLIFEDDPVQNLRIGLYELKKTLTLGSSNVAPGALTGGAALASEDLMGVVKKDKLLKAQVMAALRDWKPYQDLAKHLTHYLRDVDERFITKFADMAKDVIFTKQELSLSKSEEGGEADYMGKKVVPGKIQLTSGPFAGSSLKLMYLDDKYAYVQAFKAGGSEATPINKIPRKHEGVNWVVLQQPKVSDSKLSVDSRKHGDRLLNRTLGQDILVEGIDLNSPSYSKLKHSLTSKSIGDSDHFGWFKNGVGTKVLVKPEIESEYDSVKGFSTAKRDVVFKNLADEFFELGDNVPNTAHFTHPTTKKSYSAMELVPDAEHFSSSSRKTLKILKDAANSGKLDKLTIMDQILGQSDRASHMNYMFGKDINLIDNSLMFNFKDHMLPGYVLNMAHSDPLYLDRHVHEEAKKWAMNLDPFKLKDMMTEQGVPDEYSNESVKRLMSIQSALVLGNHARKDVLFSHHKLINPVTPNEEDQGDF